MSTPNHTGAPLGVLGLSGEDEDLYRAVLRSSPVPVPALADLTGRAVPALFEDLNRLAGVGLVDLRGDTVVAAPPDRALSRLVDEESRRLDSVQAQLDAVRQMLPALTAEHMIAREPRGVPVGVEVIPYSEVVATIRGLTAGSTGDLLWIRPDQWRQEEGRVIDTWVQELLRAGRRSRVLYPARVLEEAPEMVRGRARLGEHVRILAEVPGRLAIVGNAAALMPDRFELGDDRLLIVRQPSLVESLTLLFESLWERALAVPGLDAADLDGPESASMRRLLLDQLARGVKDEQIARALGVSLRTVRRRVADLLDELGATSRFQAGVEAVRRGWL